MKSCTTQRSGENKLLLLLLLLPIYFHLKLYKNAYVANFVYYGKTRTSPFNPRKIQTTALIEYHYLYCSLLYNWTNLGFPRGSWGMSPVLLLNLPTILRISRYGTLLQVSIITVRNEVAKVMFSQGGGGSALVHAGIPPPWEAPPPGKHTPPGSTSPRGDGCRCGRYASYWNAFLFPNLFHESSLTFLSDGCIYYILTSRFTIVFW